MLYLQKKDKKMNQVSIYKMFLIIYSKFTIKFLWKNKIKILVIIGSISLFNFSKTIKPTTINYLVIDCIEHNNHFNYIVEKESKLEVISFKEKQEIIGSRIYLLDDSTIDSLSFLSIFMGIIIIIIIIIGGYENAEKTFHHQEIIQEVIYSLSYTVLEEGIYYFMIFDRLITSSKDIHHYYAFKPSSINDILNLPKFITKHQKRENIFTLLGL